ncbi:MAG: metal-dependent transcriptional regulator [Candidatus Hermodarchaeota archaeon]|nr:metal-dependent transcriptional regulator [Candidatus Hermodarchaeota archaeon]
MNPGPRNPAGTTQEESKSTSTARRYDIPSASIEEYLEAIFRLLQNKRKYAKTGELAEVLGVKPASVTQMVQKLATKNYLKYEKSRGVLLTRKGRKLALDVLRRHRIAERLLVDLLGVSWEEAHDVACEWEHMLTPELCNRILDRLDEPATCPHGNPIPEANGTVSSLPELTLVDLVQNEKAVIDCISNENVDLLRMMAAMGMLPGEIVRIVQISPIGDTLLIEVGTAHFALSSKLAKCVRVHREKDDE